MQGLDIYLQRMKDSFWGLNAEVANLTHLAPNDKVVFYLAGQNKFLGTAVLATRNYGLSEQEKKDLWHNKFFTAKNGVRLRDVTVWSKPISIRPMIKSLNFIVNPNIGGAYLQGSIRKISLEDFQTITKQKTVPKENSALRDIALAPAKHDVDTKSTTDMLKVIGEKREIDQAEALLIAKLNAFTDKKGIISVGYQSESQKLNASWSSKLNIWWVTETSENRYWNAFGIGEPRWGTSFSHNIICEINPPFQGINRSISGIFAKDPAGKLYLMHRGKIGGGRVGIGKSKFENEFTGSWMTVEDGSVLSKIALVAAFDSPMFGEQISDFVHQIQTIKSSSSQAANTTNIPIMLASSFKEEFYGIKKANAISSKYEAECNHGLIVSTLRKQLVQNGMTIVNNVAIDLLSVDSIGNPLALFEVKTDASTTNIYGAIGQLLYHSTNLKGKCKLIAVFPSDIDVDSKNTLKRLKIDCITYSWIDNLPHFDNFNSIVFNHSFYN